MKWPITALAGGFAIPIFFRCLLLPFDDADASTPNADGVIA
jgi:hypothetical protein